MRFVNRGDVLREPLIGPESPSFGDESDDNDGSNDSRDDQDEKL